MCRFYSVALIAGILFANISSSFATIPESSLGELLKVKPSYEVSALFAREERALFPNRKFESLVMEDSTFSPALTEKVLPRQGVQLALAAAGPCTVVVYVWNGRTNQWEYSYSYRCPALVSCADCMAR